MRDRDEDGGREGRERGGRGGGDLFALAYVIRWCGRLGCLNRRRRGLSGESCACRCAAASRDEVFFAFIYGRERGREGRGRGKKREEKEDGANITKRKEENEACASVKEGEGCVGGMPRFRFAFGPSGFGLWGWAWLISRYPILLLPLTPRLPAFCQTSMQATPMTLERGPRTRPRSSQDQV